MVSSIRIRTKVKRTMVLSDGRMSLQKLIRIRLNLKLVNAEIFTHSSDRVGEGTKSRNGRGFMSLSRWMQENRF